PGNCILVQNDAPTLTILAATPSYLQETGYTKEAMIGKGIFEAFPVNMESNNTNGEDLLASYNHVILHKEPHFLPRQRYDLKNTDGSFTEKYWKINNAPVFSPDREVVYIIHTAEDITDQVRAEKRETQIKGIEKAFGLFMEAPMVVGLVNGPDYTLEMANKAALKLWGKGADIIGKPLLQSLPELAGQGIIELFDQVRNSGQPYFADEVPVTSFRDGKEQMHFFNLIYQPYYDEGSTTASGVFTISHDVTEQVVARKEVQESEAKYRSLFESMDQGFCVLEVFFDEKNLPIDYCFLETNPVFEKQTGLKKALGKTARDLVPNLEPHWFEHYGRVARTGESVRFTERSEVMGRWFDVYAFRIGDAESRKVAILFTDITEHRKVEEAIKQSEANIRNLVMQSPVAMCILSGPSFTVEVANERIYEIWGKGEAEMLGRPVFECLPAAAEQGLEDVMNHVYNTGERFIANELAVPLPRNGTLEKTYLNFVYEPFIGFDKTITGVMAVAIDVTEQVVARKKIEESHK
ncbi:MAG TPA: PAS domain-containing protein, partial [Flavisolibacter sp.]|nr:PAS domain-containing protein [Flavisolibacter sp.]